MTDAARLDDLRADGVRLVRVTFSDLHGIMRGKAIPIDAFAHFMADGVGFCKAISNVDLRHNVVGGFAHGLEDIRVRPLLDTLVRLPWSPESAWCLAEQTVADGTPYPVDPRATLERAIAELEGLGLRPVMGPELEFYLCTPDESSPSGWRRYVDQPSSVYTVGAHADPRGVLERMLLACRDAELEVTAGCHEYGASQFEINLHHSDALDACDRAFRFKAAIKELAARDGLLATFMGKPFNGQEGSGFHLHLSFVGADGANALADPDGEAGVSATLRHAVAGLLGHAPALMAVMNPTINAYRRIDPHQLVPTRACWGHDNRFAFVRVPPERGAATRLELRLADGTANPYLATAAALFAAADGLRRELEPPAPVAGLIYELPDEALGAELPNSLRDAIAALQADDALRGALGERLVSELLEIKASELERHHGWVSDWDFAEYAHHL
jgi:glutamine synthetase